ncbi:hypothetical protein QM012_008211 [Aureobasidium pullulans]|uniref:Uncharacterized protein n=1 Tax=Aureobasidium pullulans TaxID=5580 RepID=A0ABR0TIX9_AURPU
MASGLFDQLPTMNQDQGLSSFIGWFWHSFNQVTEDDRLTASSGQRNSETFLTEIKMS